MNFIVSQLASSMKFSPFARKVTGCLAVLALLANFASAEAQSEASWGDGDNPYRQYVVSALAPEYPILCRRNLWEGRGVFLLTIRADGTVSSVKVEQTTRYKYLDYAATSALRKWRFQPGKIQLAHVPVNFKMRGIKVAPPRLIKSNVAGHPDL